MTSCGPTDIAALLSEAGGDCEQRAVGARPAEIGFPLHDNASVNRKCELGWQAASSSRLQIINIRQRSSESGGSASGGEGSRCALDGVDGSDRTPLPP